MTGSGSGPSTAYKDVVEAHRSVMESHPEAEVGRAGVRLQDYLASGHVRVAHLTYFRLCSPKQQKKSWVIPPQAEAVVQR